MLTFSSDINLVFNFYKIKVLIWKFRNILRKAQRLKGTKAQGVKALRLNREKTFFAVKPLYL